MKDYKKFISPGAWFEMNYPTHWNEFEGDEESFLFYDPNVWNGNFRISAYRGKDAGFGKETVRRELKENTQAKPIRIGGKDCAYSMDVFEQDGRFYITHYWVVDGGVLSYDCTFTVDKENSHMEEAVQVIATLHTRNAYKVYPPEIIPVRIVEIYQINDAYDWVSRKVKEAYSIDFKGVRDDIKNLQRLIDDKRIGLKKKETWISLGLVLCVILTNETDGLEWYTLVDGNREVPVLTDGGSHRWIDPAHFLWDKAKKDIVGPLDDVYKKMMQILCE